MRRSGPKDLQSLAELSWTFADELPELRFGYGSIDLGMDQYLLIPFLGGWTSINPSYFDVHQGYKVLTHCHLWWSSKAIGIELKKHVDSPTRRGFSKLKWVFTLDGLIWPISANAHADLINISWDVMRFELINLGMGQKPDAANQMISWWDFRVFIIPFEWYGFVWRQGTPHFILNHHLCPFSQSYFVNLAPNPMVVYLAMDIYPKWTVWPWG